MNKMKRIFAIIACFFVLTFATFALTSCISNADSELSVKIENVMK